MMRNSLLDEEHKLIISIHVEETTFYRKGLLTARFCLNTYLSVRCEHRDEGLVMVEDCHLAGVGNRVHGLCRPLVDDPGKRDDFGLHRYYTSSEPFM
jgi:hypothetical protein